jgi:uncharacterized protein YjbI with pentapeptide repeats
MNDGGVCTVSQKMPGENPSDVGSETKRFALQTMAHLWGAEPARWLSDEESDSPCRDANGNAVPRLRDEVKPESADDSGRRLVRTSLSRSLSLPEDRDDDSNGRILAQRLVRLLCRRGVPAWNEYRRRHPTEGHLALVLDDVDLRGRNLRGLDFSGLDLRGVDLRGSDLGEANLEGANMSRLALRGVQLSRAILRGTDLRGCDLRGASLRMSNLRDTLLRGTDLTRADLWGANLTGADLIAYESMEHFVLGSAGSGARLEVQPTVLTKANLEWTTLDRCTFNEVILQDCRLARARAKDAKFSSCDFSGAADEWFDLTGAMGLRRIPGWNGIVSIPGDSIVLETPVGKGGTVDPNTRIT